MENRKCKRCGETKGIIDFYKHPQGAGGYDTKCKVCVKKAMKKRHYDKYQDPDFIESERVRCREKYKRLGYKDKQKEWDADKPWKKEYLYKGMSKILSRNGLLEGNETAHHYNYNKLNAVFVMDNFKHKQIHTKIDFCEDTLCFMEKDSGILLDDLAKNITFLDKNKIDYKFVVV